MLTRQTFEPPTASSDLMSMVGVAVIESNRFFLQSRYMAAKRPAVAASVNWAQARGTGACEMAWIVDLCVPSFSSGWRLERGYAQEWRGLP